MSLLLWLLCLDHRLVGGAGYWLDQHNTSVLYAELGYRFFFEQNLETQIRFAFSNLVRGNPDGLEHGLFVSRAFLRLGNQRASITGGRLVFDYADGLFMADPGLGSDGVLANLSAENLSLDCFYILVSQSVEPGAPPDNSVVGAYAQIGPDWLQWHVYTASNTGPGPDAWVGSRLAWDRATITMSGEMAFNRSSWAGLFQFKFWGLGTVEPGAGLFVFGPGWRAPQHYTPHPGGYYNGWGGFGEAMTWAGMTDTLLPGVISSPVSGSYGIYWPDVHSLQVMDLSLLFGITQRLSARVDGFGFWHLNDRVEIGKEISLNLIYQLHGASFGAAGGLLEPGPFLEDMGRHHAYWSARVWAFKSFELAPVK